MPRDGFYIDSNKSRLESYNNDVWRQMKKAGYDGKRTERWATPRKHPTEDKWAIPKRKDVEMSNPQSTWVEELPDDWTVEEEEE